TLHARRHHRLGQTGASGIHVRTSCERIFGRTVPPGGRRGSTSAAEAELAGRLKMNWAQFKAILWLRWRLTRNQFRRGGQVNGALSIVAAGMLAMAAVGIGIGGFALGFFAGAKAAAPVLLLIWDGVIFLF